jgi:hypothetical protein
MEDKVKKWGFQDNNGIENTQRISIGGMMIKLKENLREDDPRPTISLGLGDPSCFQCFKTCPVSEDVHSFC